MRDVSVPLSLRFTRVGRKNGLSSGLRTRNVKALLSPMWAHSVGLNVFRTAPSVTGTNHHPSSVAHIAAGLPALHHSVAVLGPGQAALLTGASIVIFAVALGGALYFGARSTWLSLEPLLTGDLGGSAYEVMRLYGVDVTDSAFFSRLRVRRAAEFAAAAHRGQTRKTGEPYVAHCIATAIIVEGLLSPAEDDARAEAAVVAAILHDVLDDAGVDIAVVEGRFGPHVASMVSKISQLSATNQLVRRRLRLNAAQATPQEAAQLRHMILTMVSEPLVIVIKLADRLHNMRTVYALPPEKQRAVAEETRRVWCSLAERLGMFALKSELEDLCFAVLQPTEYRALRAELDALWGLPSLPFGAMTPSDCCIDGACECDVEALSLRSGGSAHWLGSTTTPIPQHQETELAFGTSSSDEITSPTGIAMEDDPEASFLTPDQLDVRTLVRSVLPFDASTFNMERLTIPPSARRGLEVLQGCARALLQEITLEGVASGLDVSVQGRVKSLYSIFRKMARKGIPLAQVYDARALRVVVEDEDGLREREAIAACYKLLPAVHRLWKKVDGEDDDYITQPKPSGYQSLHTAVQGPGGIPMEVQIRTESMHADAEYGRAAHWAYKERPTVLGGEATLAVPPPREAIVPGHPVLRISPRGEFRDGVVVSTEAEGMRLLIASSLAPRRYAAAHATRASSQEYAALMRDVEDRGYFTSGQGDSQVTLELFTLCSDSKYHKIDAFGLIMATTIVPLAPFEYEGLNASGAHQRSSNATGIPTTGTVNSPSNDPDAAFLSHRIRLLRSMLEWGQDLDSTPATVNPEPQKSFFQHRTTSSSSDPEDDNGLVFEVPPQDVMVLIWPSGTIVRVPRGTTAKELMHRERGVTDTSLSKSDDVVTVNNRQVAGDTVLEDGDYVALTNEGLVNV